MRKAALIATLCVLAGAGLGRAGQLKEGGDFLVNTYTTEDQNRPDIAADRRGNFVVVWEGDDQDGSNEGIFAQRYDSAGMPIGGEFQVNVYTTGEQAEPAVAMSRSGSFVVVWTSYGQDGDSYGVFGRLFSSSGAAVGIEFQVNSYTTSYQYDPDVAMDGSGNFAVVWVSLDQAGVGNSVFARRFNSSGSPAAGEFQVDSFTAAFQYFPAVAADERGDFAVVWESDPMDGDAFGIAARIFDRMGTAAGPEFQVNTYTTGDQGEPGIAMTAQGDFLVGWDSDDQDGAQDGVFAQLFDITGMPVGAELQVNTYTSGSQDDPKIAADASGEFIVVWPSQNQDGSLDGVFTRVVDSLGVPLGDEFQVNTYTPGGQMRPSVATGPAGTFNAVWEDDNGDGSFDAVVGQRVLAHSPELLGPVGPLDCSDPSKASTRPVFTWETDTYDTFRVYMSSSDGFDEGTRVTSGDAAIKTGTWTPNKKKWRAACRKALTQSVNPNNPLMYVTVLGKDADLPTSNPSRTRFSPPVEYGVAP